MPTKPQFGLMDEAALTATTNGAAISPSPLLDEVFELDATESVAGTSLVVKIQDSFDNGLTWNDLVSFTSLATTGREVKVGGRPHGGTLRAVATIVGGTWIVRVKGAGVQAA